jgi:hypothetical protein
VGRVAIASRGRGELERMWVEDWVTTDCELLEELKRSENRRWTTLLSWAVDRHCFKSCRVCKIRQ